METRKKLQWEDKYSVGVNMIDEQHKMMFSTINELVDALKTPTKEKLEGIMNQLIQYKKFHFATEERYFKEFNYEFADEHIAQHQGFTDRLNKLKDENSENATVLAFKLIDFLEDWLIGHLMTADQKYRECFNSHGLK